MGSHKLEGLFQIQVFVLDLATLLLLLLSENRSSESHSFKGYTMRLLGVVSNKDKDGLEVSRKGVNVDFLDKFPVL